MQTHDRPDFQPPPAHARHDASRRHAPRDPRRSHAPWSTSLHICSAWNGVPDTPEIAALRKANPVGCPACADDHDCVEEALHGIAGW
jgi:hypothetical protein